MSKYVRGVIIMGKQDKKADQIVDETMKEIAEDLDVRAILLLEDGTVIDSDGADGDVAVVEE